jgi:hypothetical protein
MNKLDTSVLVSQFFNRWSPFFEPFDGINLVLFMLNPPVLLPPDVWAGFNQGQFQLGSCHGWFFLL